MGPYNHANATIGRAWGLLSTTSRAAPTPGLTYLGSQGNNYAYTSITFAENEERSPWNPFHVQHGFKPTDSTVSLFGGAARPSFTLGLREKYWEKHVLNLLRGFDPHTESRLRARPDHGAPVHRPRRLRHQGEADRVDPQERHHAGGGVLGLPADPELHLPAGDVRRGAVRLQAEAAPTTR